jgi:hypothetical protein
MSSTMSGVVSSAPQAVAGSFGMPTLKRQTGRSFATFAGVICASDEKRVPPRSPP